MRTKLSLVGLGLGVVMAACGTGGAATTTAPPTTAELATPSTAPPPATTPVGVTTAPTPTTAPATTVPPTTVAPRADTVIEVSVAAGEVTGPDRPETAVGSTVLLIVTSDGADELHVHGYDYFVDLSPGETAELEFVADIPGIFEVELEDSRTLLFELVVR